MSKIGELYRSKAEDDRKSLRAAGSEQVTQNIRSFADAIASVQRVVAENDISDGKWGSRLLTAVTTANKHVEELYSAVDQLETDMTNFMRLLMTDVKKHVINVPIQKKQTPTAAGKPLDIMPYQRGEVKRKKRRVPTLSGPTASGATTTAAAAAAVKKQKHAADEEEDNVEATTATTLSGKKARRTTRVKKTRVLPLPATVKSDPF